MNQNAMLQTMRACIRRIRHDSPTLWSVADHMREYHGAVMALDEDLADTADAMNEQLHLELETWTARKAAPPYRGEKFSPDAVLAVDHLYMLVCDDPSDPDMITFDVERRDDVLGEPWKWRGYDQSFHAILGNPADPVMHLNVHGRPSGRGWTFAVTLPDGLPAGPGAPPAVAAWETATQAASNAVGVAYAAIVGSLPGAPSISVERAYRSALRTSDQQTVNSARKADGRQREGLALRLGILWNVDDYDNSVWTLR